MKSLILWGLLFQGGDIATTGIGLSRGCEETAPLYRSTSFPVIATVKGGSAIYVSIYLWKNKEKRPKLTKAVGWAMLASGVLGTVWNLHQIPNCQ